ncbi:MAG: hypothetical protein HOO86_01295 [Bacteroidales bacterium]|nr:hypothetical protein [Bacteroidales bacterium]
MKSIFLTSAGILLLILSFSCIKENSTKTEEYVIKVDSIHVTDNVKVGKNITVAFFGIIGNDGCSSFSRYILKNKGKIHQVTVVGKRRVGENLMCPENLPLLNGMTLDIKADSIGSHIIEIINPGINNLITKNITVIP